MAKAAVNSPQQDRIIADRGKLDWQIVETQGKLDDARKRRTEADAAAKLADQLEANEITPDLEGAPTALTEARGNLKLCQDDKDRLAGLKREADEAQAKTKRAKELHELVVKWDSLASALGPSGIPAEILEAALGPLAEQLEAAAEATGWAKVEVSANMEISAGGFRYELLSESAQWRVDAMLACAIARISGVNLLVLDRLDVCDLAGRNEALGWLYGISGETQVIVFATLKAKPKMPEGSKAFWLGEEAA